MAIQSFSHTDRTSETGDGTRRVILYSVQCCYAALDRPMLLCRFGQTKKTENLAAD